MLGYFPKPQNDELLYSVIARFKIHHGLTSDRQVVTKLFGSRDVAAVVDFPGHLRALERNTFHITGITAERWLMGHTMYPAYQHFLQKERREQLVASLLEGRAWNVHTRIGQAAFALKSPLYLKMCRACSELQMQKDGEPHWQRLFQMNGLYICPAHEEHLVNTNIPFRPVSKFAFVAACEAKVGPVAVKEYTRQQADALVRLGEELAALLASDHREVNSLDQWTCYYSCLAQQSNSMLSTARVNHAAVRNAVEDYWSRSLLTQFGIDFSPQKSWLTNLFRKHRKSFHYLHHVAAWLALDGRHISNILDHVSTLTVSKKKPMGSIMSAAKNVVVEKRNEWLFFQKCHPDRGVKWLREHVADAVYAWLYRNDREWLLNNVPAKMKTVTSVQVVDWHARDELLLKQCKALHKKKLLVNLHGRTSMSWLMKQLDRSASLEKNRKKLPLTTSYLSNLAESIETYQQRRIVQVITALYKQQEQIKTWMVYRKAGIRKQYQTPSLQNFIYSVLRKCLLGSARLFSKNPR